MIGRFIRYFQESVRNKLVVLLSAVVSLILIFPFSVSILSLRRDIQQHFIQDMTNRFMRLSENVADESKKEMFARAFLGDALVYIKVEGMRHHEMLHEQVYREGYSLDSLSAGESILNNDNLRVRHMTMSGKGILEFRKRAGKYFLTAGLTTAAMDRLILKEMFILLIVSVLAIAALVLFIILISGAVTEPLRRLTQVAEGLSQGKRDFSHDTFAERKDEVGLLAKSIFDLATDLDRQEKTLAEQKAHAEVGKVAAQVAHDLRSPLSGIQASGNYFIGNAAKDKESTDFANLLQLSANRLNGIVNDLLFKYRGTSQPKTIFSLCHVLDELIGEYQDRERYKKIQFTKEYHPQAIELYGESRKLQRAFGNIIKNATEAMYYQGTLTVRTELRQGSVVVSIADTGQGMSKEKLEKVLRGGFTEGKEDGHGIGTKVIRETVEEFQGNLSAESKEGYGSTFFIEIPLPSEEVRREAPRERMAIEKVTLLVKGEEPVLVIDDDPSIREQWRLMLEQGKCKVILCESFEDFEKRGVSPQTTKTAVVDYHFNNSAVNGELIVRELQKRGFARLPQCTAEYWKQSRD